MKAVCYYYSHLICYYHDDVDDDRNDINKESVLSNLQ